MNKPLLCVSWLNGQLKAVAMQRGSAAGTWDRPDSLPDFAALAPVIAEAAAMTRPEGRHVAMVLAHPRLSHQVLEVPPAKGRTLDRIFERSVRTLKTFTGDPAWAAQPAMPTKNSDAALLQVFPQALVDQLAAACTQNGLQLVRLLSTTTVLSSQLKKLPLAKDELALLAAETNSTTTVVIGRGDGRVCLARTLINRWNQQLEPLSVELMRTIGFAEQQSGLVVGSVWLFGTGAQAQAPVLESLLHLPVKVSPVEPSPFYWAEQAAKLPEKDDANLITIEARQAPRRRRLLTLTSLILLILLAVSLASTGFIEARRRDWLVAIEKQEALMLALQKQRDDWQKRNAGMARQMELVRVVLDENLPPIPAMFLSYVTEAVPDELLLTELRVARTNDAWSVRMAGAAQPTTNSSPETVFRAAITSMTNKLISGPFHVKVDLSVMSGAPTSRGAGEGTNHTFLIEGVIP